MYLQELCLLTSLSQTYLENETPNIAADLAKNDYKLIGEVPLQVMC